MSDGDWFRAALIERVTMPCIPSKSNRKVLILYNHALYWQRQLVENTFGKLKDWQRIYTRRPIRPYLLLGHRRHCYNHLLTTTMSPEPSLSARRRDLGGKSRSHSSRSTRAGNQRATRVTCDSSVKQWQRCLLATASISARPVLPARALRRDKGLGYRDAALHAAAEPEMNVIVTRAPVLSTARLSLVPVGAADVDAIAGLHADHRVTRYILDGIPDEPWKARRYIEWAAGLHVRGIGPWSVRRRCDDRFIGLFTLTPNIDGDDESLEFGGRLTRSGWPGDLGVEAGAGLIGHAFDRLGRHELVSIFDPANSTAPTALARLGFDAPRPVVIFGRDAIEVRLSAETWRVQGSAPLPRRSRHAVERTRAG